MFKLRTKVSVVKMSQYLENQHSTQTAIKPIVFKQSRIKNREVRVDLNVHDKKCQRCNQSRKRIGAIYREEPTEKTILK
jgi:hypothetical protein